MLQCISVNLITNHQSTLKLQLQRFRVDDKIIAPWILVSRELRCHASPTQTRAPSVGPHLLANELIYLAAARDGNWTPVIKYYLQMQITIAINEEWQTFI